MFVTLKELADLTKSRLIGDPEAKISCVASIQRASNCDLVYCENEKYLAEALASAAAAVVAGEFAASTVDAPKPLLLARQPRLAFALAAKRLRTGRRRGGIVHQTAIVPPTAVFGDDVVVGAYVVLGDHVTIGNRVAISAGVCIGSNVTIGDDCEIHSRVTIYHGTKIGTHCVVHSGTVLGADGFGYVRDEETGRYQQMPQIGNLMIGDYVEVGANTTIDRGGLEDTVIGSGTKIDNLVHVGHNVKVGENVVMAAQVGISGSTEIGANAILAGQVGISEHVRIGDGVILGGQAGVFAHKVMRQPGVPHFGTPARPLPDVMKEMATLSRITRKKE